MNPGDYYYSYMVVGTNGTGKSTWIDNQIIQAIVKVNANKRILIVAPENAEKLWHKYNYLPLKDPKKELEAFRGVAVVNGARPDIIDVINHYYRSGILILDDFSYYIEANLTQSVRQLLTMRRQFKLHIYSLTHGFTEVPPKFIPRLTHFEIFKSSDNPARHREKLSPEKFDVLMKIVNRVNAHPDFHYHETFDIYGKVTK